MDFSPSVEREFDAGHHLEGAFCHPGSVGYHRWKIRATAKGTYDAKRGSSIDMKDLQGRLLEALSEIDGRLLNDMLPASAPTPEGLGLWVMERLSAHFPKSLVEVTVWLLPHSRFSIRRDPR